MKQLVLIMSLIAALLSALNLKAQSRQESVTVGFYNLENLFDTNNNLATADGDFTPDGAQNWTVTKYQTKLRNLSRAISLFNPDILGVCEVESESVLRDLTYQEALSDGEWGVVHYDSPDPRGIDVGMIYRSDHFQLLESEPIRANFNRPTRDILRVVLQSIKSGERFVVMVVHLPSRRNNDPKATAQRKAMLTQINALVAATVNIDKNQGVIVCGDFNDNPTSSTMKRTMGSLFNASSVPYARGMGSYIYQDTYLMYDQILISHNMKQRLLDTEQKIVDHPTLLQQGGRFASYPAKGTTSDHLPVYLRFGSQERLPNY